MANPTKASDPAPSGGGSDRESAATKAEPPERVVPAGDGAEPDAHPPQNEHDEQLITEEFAGLDNDLVSVATFGQPAWDDDGLDPPDEDEDRPDLPAEAAAKPSDTARKT
ncbi:hypothetical protein [Aureimonas pseudogalii]|uniref:Uncharacterized protein n=1 Tax=Aureimonas pseudogalii TaxID=1744844 RepID=A0A7W6EFI1_9HYPH|nr:hypothetical protein [Aureimonas pseudogalii]MBB3997273.1 hypothetical protein [Aureimonas pseudogalii]